MKTIFKLSSLVLLIGLFSSTVHQVTGWDVLTVSGGVTVLLLMQQPVMGGALFTGITTTQLAAELGAYFRTHSEEIRSIFYQPGQAVRYLRPLTKVKGEFPAAHALLTSLIQPFSKAWNAVGDFKLKANKLENSHVKFDLEIYPSDVLSTWAAFLYAENMKAQDMPISKYIVQQHLKPALDRDIDNLIGNGDVSGGATPFLQSINGLKLLLTNGLADDSMYKIPLPTSNASNILANVEAFEDNIPDNIRPFITKIIMSSRMADWYKRDVRNTYGTAQDFQKGELMRTYVGNRDIIGLNCLNGWNGMFATPDQNLLRLINLEAPPTPEIEQEDRKVKIFADWFDGVAFWTNQYVLVSSLIGSGSGLATDNDEYYS